jgi:hypothetical protein
LSSTPYTYSGFFSITSGILLTTSILYIIFLPGIALGQEWIGYKNWDFSFSYPAFLRAYEAPYGVGLIPASEIGSEKPSFGYHAYAYPYDGLSRTWDELANEIASMIVQTNPNVQFIYVGPNNAGNLAIVEYTYDDSRAVSVGQVFNGKFYVYGFNIVMGPNESQYFNIGNSIMNSMTPIIPTSNGGGLAATQPNDGGFPLTERALDRFTEWNKENGASIEGRIERQREDDFKTRTTPGTPEFCLNNQFHEKC